MAKLQPGHDVGEDPGLAALERANYRRALADGILDLGIGLMILGMAVVWLLAESRAGLAAIVPAALVVPLLEVRRRTTEARGGYVRFTAARRAAERASLRGALALGAALFACAVIAFAVVQSGDRGSALESLSAGLPGLLVALPLALGAALTGLPRVTAYSLVILAAAVAVATLEANPGWPLLAGGVVMTATGVVLLVRYVRRNPLPPGEGA